MNDELIRIDALAVVDAAGTFVAPASVLASPGTADRLPEIVAVGEPSRIDGHPLARAASRVDRRDSILIPGLINAHTHLDLTHIGPRRHDPAAGFVGFAGVVGPGRAETDDLIAASVRRGIELSRAAGVVAVGDIAGSPRGRGSRASLVPWRELRAAGMLGVSSLEFFARWNSDRGGLDAISESLSIALEESKSKGALQPRIGLSPHAPYSVSLDGYRWAAEQSGRHGLPLVTHLAETPEERRYIASGSGPFRTFLESIGVWDDSFLPHLSGGLHPIDHLLPALPRGGMTLVHVNDCPDPQLEALTAAGHDIIYCPRASTYFGAEAAFGPHRYREMLRRGLRVGLGTDSIVNLPASAADPGAGEFGVLGEMRFLWKRDRHDALSLLGMGTTMAAPLVGLSPDWFRFPASGGSGGSGGGPIGGLVAIRVVHPNLPGTASEAMKLALESAEPPTLLLSRTISC